MRRLGPDQRGTATIEFALLSLFFFGVIVVALDFGMFVQQKLRLGSAVEQAGLMAFNTRDAVNPVNLSNYIVAAAQTKTAPTASITCNQGQSCVNSNRQCACYNAATGIFTDSACSTTCADGALSGYYLKISATMPYTTLVAPNAWLRGATLSQTAVVRLQ